MLALHSTPKVRVMLLIFARVTERRALPQASNWLLWNHTPGPRRLNLIANLTTSHCFPTLLTRPSLPTCRLLAPVHPSIYLPACLSSYCLLSAYFRYFSICPSVCPSVRASVRPFIYLPLCRLSVRLIG